MASLLTLKMSNCPVPLATQTSVDCLDGAVLVWEGIPSAVTYNQILSCIRMTKLSEIYDQTYHSCTVLCIACMLLIANPDNACYVVSF